ncbi:hypothetical protein [Bradyrhizobium sp. USDA 4350]
MNDETILALGGFCKELLGAEAFQALVQMYSQQCAADILHTKPSDKSERESIYAAYQGFEGFLSLAQKFAEGFDKLTAETVSTPDQDIDDPSVHDIYDGH